MAKEKPVTKEVVVAKEALVPVDEDAGLAVMDLMRQHVDTIRYDPGFMPIKVAKGSKSFTLGAIGTRESPLVCIFLSVNYRRGLWPPDKTVTKEQLAAAFRCLPDELGDLDLNALNGWRGKLPICGSSSNGGTKGKAVRVLDASAPPIAEKFLTPPIMANYVCDKCQWNDFGTDWKGSRGKACKESPMFLLWFQEEDMAATLSISPTSIRAWKDYKVSCPGQHFDVCFTSISTAPTTVDDQTWNLVDFAPEKKKNGTIVMVEPAHVASLGMEVSYGGRECTKYEALIAEFLNIELEEEQDYPNGSGETVAPYNTAGPPAEESGDDDQPF